ncbi:intraflagellar transport protein 46 homolog isoform X8 [Aricia agestis]|uniref:intraflagellar transport protein 46 homolog isoform X8 n=1 Tax=Aricia agestis TaxID=91739 RepID=UPI001C2068DF|nr:intraflagellar transport protein 46 homolog isoform X8 [Aricia agestis]XP_041969497.1 intraflagellar transport protein 46 homolog isoform X8 [Aricia agestis]
MAHVEPMDVDSMESDYEDKENSILHSNVIPKIPCTEKGYEELDASELNMKLRYSITPASSPMSRSYTANCKDNKNIEERNSSCIGNANLTNSFNSTLTNNDINNASKVYPLQTLPTENLNDMNRNVLLPKSIDKEDKNVTITVSNSVDENISIPSTSSSITHTPESTTPTKELPKDGGSPIMRGLRSVLSMFKPQSPGPSHEQGPQEDSGPLQANNTITDESPLHPVEVSTPLRTTNRTSPKRTSPHRDSINFNDDLEKELQWKDDSTILFKEEKIPKHKLFLQESVASNIESKILNKTKEECNGTIEYMDISYNDSALIDKTMTDIETKPHGLEAGGLESDAEARGMYDETVEVEGREIESPADSEEEVMAKFNPPAKHTARHDFDSDSDSDLSPEKSKPNLSEDDKSLEFKMDQKDNKNQKGKKEISRQSSKQMDSYDSDTDSDDVGVDRADPLLAHLGSGRKRGGVVIPAEGAYDPKLYQDLKAPPELDNLFQYIMKYTPQKIDIEFRLQPFVPDYVPAVGDADALIKVTTPAAGLRAPLPDNVLEFIDNLGLTVLDEPSSEQSDSALLHLQLRAISKTSSAKSTVVTRKIENAEKNPKAIERWIKDVSELHMSKPAPTVTYTNKMPDIDSLMEEWPETMEDTLNEVGFPPANIDCTLSQYVDLVCGIFDIPVHGNTLNDRIQALHLLFSLYSAVKNSQLYSEREKEKNG